VIEPTSPNEARRNRLRDTLALGGFVTLAGLVPWRGALAADAGCRVRALAGELGTDPRIAAISITDSAGGHAMLSPEVLASQLATDGIDAIVHVACRDRNRNEFLSLVWRLARTGIGNPQVLSGDYPTGLPRGRRDRLRPRLCEPARPVRGPQPGRGRPRRGGPPGPPRPDPRGGAARAAASQGSETAQPTDFVLGAAVNPFKRVERDVVPQYAKLAAKARTSARFAITQVGYDPRKPDELGRFVADEGLPLRLWARAYERLKPFGEAEGMLERASTVAQQTPCAERARGPTHISDAITTRGTSPRFRRAVRNTR
jgi:methylenetetrahydrofolate reductase (NADPH)